MLSLPTALALQTPMSELGRQCHVTEMIGTRSRCLGDAKPFMH
jgi:hypothetical protein